MSLVPIPTSALEFPMLRLYDQRIFAGFPSPAEDTGSVPLDLNTLVAPRPASTFYLRMKGHALEHRAVLHGDVLVVDRSVKPRLDDVVVMILNDEFCVGIWQKREDEFILERSDREIILREHECVELWGVVTGVLRLFRSPIVSKNDRITS